MSQYLNIDCMDAERGLPSYPDKFFDLAIVDPPYGIGEDGKSNHSRGNKANPRIYMPKNWDISSPPKEYFDELSRVSKNVIAWGANHFIEKIPINSPCWIVWDKQNGDNDFADCELALTTYKTAVRKFEFRWAGMLQGNMKNKQQRIHPTEKPMALYRWLCKHYAKPGDAILDTHAGSASSLVVYEELGFEYHGFEIDADYYKAGNERLEAYRKQGSLFTPKQIFEATQTRLEL